jgi:DNA-binding NarL/FixJ family response regulator
MKIMIVDEHRIVLDGLRALLQGAGFTVVGSVTSGREAITRAHELCPDLVLIEVATADLSGIQATRVLSRELPQLKILVLAARSDRHSVLEMFAAGAHGYLSKSAASAEELVRAIREVAAGHKYVSPALTSLVVTGGESAGPKPISAREREVLKLLAEGKSSKEIASALRVALPTIETHRRQIMTKLGLRSVAQLTKYAVIQGLTPLEPE